MQAMPVWRDMLAATATMGVDMGSEYEFVLSEREGDTVTIWLDNPNRLNVLTRAMIGELTAAFNEAGDSSATGVILAAKGRLFCAGHDFGEMAGKQLREVRDLFRSSTEMMETMQTIPQPVVARVHALATGAGCQLVATADLAVASEDASFCTPGGKGGLFCTTPMVAVGRSIGRKRALEMSMSGEPIDARTAEAWGLINRVVPADQLEEATAQFLGRVTRGSVTSKGVGKLAFYAQIGLDQVNAYAYAVEVMAEASISPDAQEGITAFIEKRPPVWDTPT